jgi:2-methylisocitrate lyase-like PEP mutase family enzyme
MGAGKASWVVVPVSLNGMATASPAQAASAQLFRALHHQPELLVLPNIWDAGSAALLAQVPGVQALATTSAGMAAAHGIRDGEQLSPDEILAAVAQITRAVALPVSVDLEAGYGRAAPEVADSVASVIEVGAVGVNLEDGVPADQNRLLAPQSHAERIMAARAVAEQLGVPIVINARTDVYWRRIGPPERWFAETVHRLRRYAAAGADCVFVPGFPGPDPNAARGRALIGQLVRELDGIPVNLLADSALPPVADLQALGVRRLSVGSALYRLGMATVCEAAGTLLRSGHQNALQGAARLSYQELANALPPAGQQ